MYWQSAASVKAHGGWAASHYLNMRWKMPKDATCRDYSKSVYHLFVLSTWYIWCDVIAISIKRNLQIRPVSNMRPVMPKELRALDVSWFPTRQQWESWWWHLQCATSTERSLHLHKSLTSNHKSKHLQFKIPPCGLKNLAFQCGNSMIFYAHGIHFFDLKTLPENLVCNLFPSRKMQKVT